MSQSPSSDSSGILRAQRTPSRHSPYRRGHHSGPSRGGGENFNPMGPGHPGDFNAQYPAYNGNSSAGYGMPFAPVHNYEPSRRLSSLTTAVNIDELSTQYGLDSAQRKAAHDFSKVRGPSIRCNTLSYSPLSHSSAARTAQSPCSSDSSVWSSKTRELSKRSMIPRVMCRPSVPTACRTGGHRSSKSYVVIPPLCLTLSV